MQRFFRATVLPGLVSATVALSAQAQDQFGAAVHIIGDDILVMKPHAGLGPGSVFVFRHGSDGTWHVAQQFSAPDVARTGEDLNPSMASSGASVFVASGDPNSAWGAHVFELRGSDWAPARGIPLAPPTEGVQGDIDLGTVMRILQPPPRVIAVDGDRAVVSVRGGSAPVAGVHVFERVDGSGWVEGARVAVPNVGTREQFGAAIAMQGNWLLVGAPRYGSSGAVFAFHYEASTGEWAAAGQLDGTGVADRGQFGSSITFDGPGRVMVGAPVSRTGGTIVFFALDQSGGEWNPVGRITSGDAENDLFGYAIAVSADRMLVGAPGNGGRSGSVYAYTRDGDSWGEGTIVAITDLHQGFRLGASMAIAGDVAVIGAPAAHGNTGKAAVLRRNRGEWSLDAWLDAGETLEAITGGEVACSDEGRAAAFECDNVDLLAFLPMAALGGAPGERVSDIWGWTDPETGREYALVGQTQGLVVIDITDPTHPARVGIVRANPSGARDIKVYADHAFMTGDGAGNHGLLVFDLARLRDVANPPVEFDPDAKYEGIASAHNLIIDTEGGYAVPVGASGGGETCGGGLHMVDIREPKHPTFAGCYTDTEGLIHAGRTHDGQCVVYRGPDEKFRDRHICFVSNETALRIVDVTDKANPVPISAVSFPGRAYIHQGWLTEDQRYFYLDDELDELVGQTERTRTMIWDMAELEDPILVGDYLGPDVSTDHNLFVKGDRMYQANYQAGLRVIDISDPEHPVEVGFFDTTPYDGNPPGFNGAWTAFPFFESGTVIVSSMYEGLFVLRPRPQRLVP